MFKRNKHLFTKIPFALDVGEGSSANTFLGAGDTHLRDFVSVQYP